MNESENHDFVHCEEKGGCKSPKALKHTEEGGGGGELTRAMISVVCINLHNLQNKNVRKSVFGGNEKIIIPDSTTLRIDFIS